MNAHRLHRTLHHILALSIAAAGCSTTDTEDFDPVACDNNGGPDYLSALKLTPPVDYMERRQFASEVSATDPSFIVVQTSGTKCASAGDKAACEAAIAAATSTTGLRELGGCVQICQVGYLVVNRGDDVSVIATKDALLKLIDPVDSPADAVLAASLGGYDIACGDRAQSGVRSAGDHYEVVAQRNMGDCPIQVIRSVVEVGRDAQLKELESEVVGSAGCIGRRPAGLRGRRAAATSPSAAYWSSVAHLEAASVYAFATLARELAHHGGPPELIRDALCAMKDEARHASVTKRLARRYGGSTPRPRIERHPVRSLEAVALENAVEGCVGETFGALLGA